MLQTATILLGLTAAGGLLMALMRFMGKDRPPSWLAMVHGLLAASGLSLALYAGFTGALPTMAWIGLLLLIIAAAGGAFLNLAFHAQGKALPKGIVAVHGALAAAGFGVLLVSSFR